MINPLIYWHVPVPVPCPIHLAITKSSIQSSQPPPVFCALVFVHGGWVINKDDFCFSNLQIIVDTYGGWGAHGGGAFSGKDYTKVSTGTQFYTILECYSKFGKKGLIPYLSDT
jgi:hypothetical protein